MPKKDVVNPNQFDRRITLQKNQPTYDPQGGEIENWTDVCSFWADKQDLPHGRGLFMRFMFMQKYPQATTTFQIRCQHTVKIDPTMRVKFVAHGITHYYKLLGPPENPHDSNVTEYLLCQESQAKAVN